MPNISSNNALSIMIEVILKTVGGYANNYQSARRRGGGGEARVKLLTHLRTKAPSEADMTSEFRAGNFVALPILVSLLPTCRDPNSMYDIVLASLGECVYS